jgi:ATP-dependent RNA helicase HelY
VVSAVLYESRGGDGPGAAFAAEVPTQPLRQALLQTARLSSGLRADEQAHRIAPSREPDDGFVNVIYRWARTGDLAAALAAVEAYAMGGSGSPLLAGDFVRWCRQVLDMLDQVRNAAPDPELRATAKRAINDVRRGVVAVDAG